MGKVGLIQQAGAVSLSRGDLVPLWPARPVFECHVEPLLHALFGTLLLSRDQEDGNG